MAEKTVETSPCLGGNLRLGGCSASSRTGGSTDEDDDHAFSFDQADRASKVMDKK
jgi:hypothetical protein